MSQLILQSQCGSYSLTDGQIPNLLTSKSIFHLFIHLMRSFVRFRPLCPSHRIALKIRRTMQTKISRFAGCSVSQSRKNLKANMVLQLEDKWTCCCFGICFLLLKEFKPPFGVNPGPSTKHHSTGKVSDRQSLHLRLQGYHLIEQLHNQIDVFAWMIVTEMSLHVVVPLFFATKRASDKPGNAFFLVLFFAIGIVEEIAHSTLHLPLLARVFDVFFLQFVGSVVLVNSEE